MTYNERKQREDTISYNWELQLAKGTEVDYYVWRKSYLKSLRETKKRLEREDSHRRVMAIVDGADDNCWVADVVTRWWDKQTEIKKK